MDWTFKPSAWGFGEIGGEEDGFTGGSSRLENNNNNVGVFSVDLKLGGSMEKPNGGSSKRACVIYGACLVEGCTADLNNCREYYRRHRVCERHSKTPTVIVRGKQQRFCQQCSRFQSLEEFDEQKRSCRKRLDGHNRRRRKPQREPFSLSSGSFLSNDQDLYLTIVEPGPDYSLLAMHQGAHNSASNGGRQLSCSPSSYTTSAAAAGAVPSWPVKHEQDQHFSNHQTEIPNSSATGGGGGGKTFPFLLTNDTGRSNQTVPDIPTHHWLDDNNHKQVLLSGELVVNSKRALSLLSTRVTNRPTTDVQFDDDSVPYPPNNTVGISSYNEGFHVAPDDMLAEGASHVLPFCWK